MITLFHATGTRSHLVRFVLEELGLPYEVRSVATVEGAHKAPAYLAINPMGQLPAVQLDDGQTICESAAIAVYLTDLRPERGLAPPANDPARAAYYHWTVFSVASELMALSQIAMHTMGLPPAARVPAIAEQGRASWRDVARTLTAALEGRRFLLGDALSTADLMVGGSLWLSRLIGVVEDYPALVAYFERVRARPSFDKAFAGAPPLPPLTERGRLG